MVFPLGSHLADVPKLADADVNICMYREFGRQLCETLERPYLQAPIGLHTTTKFLRKLGELTGVDPEPFIEREKHTTIKPLWDLWRSVTQDFFGTASFAIVATETYARGMRNFLEDDMGLPCTFAFARSAGRQAGQRRRARGDPQEAAAGPVRQLQRTHVSGRGRRRARMYIPASFPGAIIRRAHRHAVHGLCRRDLSGAGSLQRAVRRAVQHPAARPDLDRVEATPARLHAELPWDDEAQALLDELIEAEPVLVRISAAKRLRDAAERAARAGRRRRVSPRARCSAAREALAAGAARHERASSIRQPDRPAPAGAAAAHRIESGRVRTLPGEVRHAVSQPRGAAR